MKIDIDELTRQGKNICDKGCNKPKRMYYVPWCPRCEKPEVEQTPTLNLLKCLYHLEAIGNEGFKDRFWEYLCENNIMTGNDSYFELYFEKKYDKDNETKQVYKDKKLIKDTFNLGDSVLMWVSW